MQIDKRNLRVGRLYTIGTAVLRYDGVEYEWLSHEFYAIHTGQRVFFCDEDTPDIKDIPPGTEFRVVRTYVQKEDTND